MFILQARLFCSCVLQTGAGWRGSGVGGVPKHASYYGQRAIHRFRSAVHPRACCEKHAVCLYTEDGDLVGLLQAINKKHGVFTSANEKLLQTLCAQSGVMMHHTDMLRTTHKQSQARFDLCQYSVKVLSCPDLFAMCKLIASHGAKVQQHTLQHTLQHIATRTTTCSITLQHSATLCNTLQHSSPPTVPRSFLSARSCKLPHRTDICICIYIYVYICIYMYTYSSVQIYTASL